MSRTHPCLFDYHLTFVILWFWVQYANVQLFTETFVEDVFSKITTLEVRRQKLFLKTDGKITSSFHQ